MKIKKGLIVLIISLMLPMVAMADDNAFIGGLQETSEMIGGAMRTSVGMIQYGLTALAFAFAIGGYFMGSNYIKKKQEQNQGNEAPQMIRIGLPVASAIMGLAVVFVVIGLFGKVFLGHETMTASWKWAVTDVLTGENSDIKAKEISGSSTTKQGDSSTGDK